jgi:nucleoside-diphosphate-sugar epimerase
VARILVTGASGLIGRRVTAMLRTGGDDVVTLARRAGPGVDRVCDLLDPVQVDASIRAIRPDVVVHAAWETAHGTYWEDESNLAWTAATLLLARHAAEAGATAFIGVGTCAEQPGPLPPTLYGIAKTSARDVLIAWGPARPLRVAWASLFFVYAEDEPPNKLIASAARAFRRDTPFVVRSPDDEFDFVHADDAAAAIAFLATHPLAGRFDVGTGTAVRVEAVVRNLAGLTGGRVEIAPTAEPAPRRAVADCAPLAAHGWQSRVQLDEGLSRFVSGALPPASTR